MKDTTQCLLESVLQGCIEVIPDTTASLMSLRSHTMQYSPHGLTVGKVGVLPDWHGTSNSAAQNLAIIGFIPQIAFSLR